MTPLPPTTYPTQGQPTVLLIDLGTTPSTVDGSALHSLAAYAATQRGDTAGRDFDATALIGDVNLLDSPGDLVWLDVDAVWPSWPDAAYAAQALEALTRKAAQRVRIREVAERHEQLSETLRFGAYCTTLDGNALLWADQNAARILGHADEKALLGSGRRPVDLWADPGLRERFVKKLLGSPEHIASVATELRRDDGTCVRVRLFSLLGRSDDGQQTIIGLIHEYGPLLSEREIVTREDVATLLDQLGYAYFVADADGRTLFSNRKDRELLGGPSEADVHEHLRGKWWVRPEERTALMDLLREKGRVTDYPALLQRSDGTRRWVEADCCLLRSTVGDGVAMEGLYRDATRRRFAERMSRALSDVGASDAGIGKTAASLCEAAAYLFEAPASALLLRDEIQHRVFPIHIHPASAGPASTGQETRGVVLDEARWPWLARLPGRGRLRARASNVREMIRPLFGDMATRIQALMVLPLHATTGHATPSGTDSLATGYIWIPLTEPLSFSHHDFGTEIAEFLQLCSRQLSLSSSRDAASLVRHVLGQPGRTKSLRDVDHQLAHARKLLQERLPTEGCSIFRFGMEERHMSLELVSTSGLRETAPDDGAAGGREVGSRAPSTAQTPDRPRSRKSVAGHPGATYEIGDGLTGEVAEKGKLRLSFEVTREPGHLGKHVEDTAHAPQTWVGVPLRDRSGRTVGVLRCLNRLVAQDRPEVTGFGFLDIHVLEELASACGLLVELAFLQEERNRSLARVAHEIGTPAVGIRNNVELLVEKYDSQDEDAKEKVKLKLADLQLDVQVLLNQVALLQGGDLSQLRERRETYLHTILQKTFHQLIPEIRRRRFDAGRVLIAVLDVPALWLPPGILTQIVFNLFTNSLKYSKKEPAAFGIAIQSEIPAAGSPYRVHFRDWGIGVEARYREAIFQDQYRSPAARAHTPRGLGLGLTICRKLAQQLGGDVGVESLRDPTDFVLSIPTTLARRP